jgi:hypothetical protein
MLGLLGGLIGGAAKAITGLYQNGLANDIHPEYTPYKESPYASQKLGIAQQLFNGRAPGAANMERNIYNSGANALSGVGRNATDSSQLLALGAGIAGQTQNAFGDLQTKEQQNKYNLLDNLNQGYEGMTNEGDKVYRDKMMKYQMDVAQQAQLRGAAFSNIFGGFNDAASTAAMNEQQNQQNKYNQQYLSLLGR